MGKLNLLQAAYRGKVGETVGQKWKNLRILRTLVDPKNPRTPAQVKIREGFAKMTEFLALVTDQIKYLSSLNPKGMSIRNMLIKINKDQVIANQFDPETLIMNKGGLPKPIVSAAALNTTDKKVTVTFAAMASSMYTEKAKVVSCVVSKKQNNANVADISLWSDYATGAMNTTIDVGWSGDNTEAYTYTWIIDTHSSSRVGSLSTEFTLT